MNETRNSNDDRIEILEAASTLMSIRRHCDERIRWQRVRNSLYLPHPSMNHFYGQVWPFYKPYPYDVTSLPMHQPFPFPISPYMVGPPRPWYPEPQQWFGPMRNQISAAPSLQTPITSSSMTDNSRMEAAMEMTDDVPDDNEDSLGEHDEYTPADKYEQKRKRRNLTKKQQEILENAYSNTKYPHIEERLKLGQATQLTEDRIQIWFQNRRAKDRRMTDIIKSPSSAKNHFVIPKESHKESDGSELDDEGGEGRRTEFPSPNRNSVIEGKWDSEPSPKRMKHE